MRGPRAAVIVFPGSTCEFDTYYVLKELAGIETELVWHEDFNPEKFEIVFFPGGFTYADYLRAGTIASLSPAVQSLKETDDKVVVGICNGFQILVEARMLEGALTRNLNMRFVSKRVRLRVENNETPFTNLFEKGEILSLWVAHAEGRFVASRETLDELERGRVLLRYIDNPNGSMNNIAGIVSENMMIIGLMPHPERSAEPVLGDDRGLLFFKSLKNWFK